MNYASLIPAILFGLAGLTAIIYFCRILFSAVFPQVRFSRAAAFFDPQRLRQRQKLSKKEALLKKAEMFIKSGSFSKARSFFQDAFIFSYQGINDAFLEDSYDHNLSVIQLLLKHADQNSLRILNLPIIEELFQRRNSLIRLYLDTLAKTKGSKNKPASGQGWAGKEFSRKINDLRERLEINQKSLQTEITKIFDLLEGGGSTESEQFH